MARFEVVKDSCAVPRYEVWDSEKDQIVAAFGNKADAEADAERRNRGADQ